MDGRWIMSFKNVLFAVAIAFMFLFWPVIGKYSKASPAWVGAIVSIFTGLVFVCLSTRQFSESTPKLPAILTLVFAGAVNGVGMYLYTAKTTDVLVPTGIFLVTISVAMIIVGPLLDFIFNGQTITFRQFLACVFAIVAIYFLKK